MLQKKGLEQSNPGQKSPVRKIGLALNGIGGLANKGIKVEWRKKFGEISWEKKLREHELEFREQQDIESKKSEPKQRAKRKEKLKEFARRAKELDDKAEFDRLAAMTIGLEAYEKDKQDRIREEKEAAAHKAQLEEESNQRMWRKMAEIEEQARINEETRKKEAEIKKEKDRINEEYEEKKRTLRNKYSDKLIEIDKEITLHLSEVDILGSTTEVSQATNKYRNYYCLVYMDKKWQHFDEEHAKEKKELEEERDKKLQELKEGQL